MSTPIIPSAESSVCGTQVCKERDDFIADKELWHSLWHVYLNNGEEVFDDDGRMVDGQPIQAAWIRLKNYCDTNGLWIDRIYLRFRSHYEHIQPAEGYFFKKGALGSIGMATRNYMILGRVLGEEIHVQKWKTPELIVEEEGVRVLSDNLEYTILSPAGDVIELI